MRVLLNLREWAERLRVQGTLQQMDFAGEILELVDLEEEIAEPYDNLCDDLDEYLPKGSPYEGKPGKALEWIGDRSNLLEEIKDTLTARGRMGDPDDEVKSALDELEEIGEALRTAGHWTEGDLLDAVRKLCEAAPVVYDL